MPDAQTQSDAPEPLTDDQSTNQVPELTPAEHQELFSTLIKGQNNSILTASELPFGTVGTANIYRVLPTRLADSAQGHTIKWRIELHGLSRDLGPIGIDIVSDVILGRGAGSSGALTWISIPMAHLIPESPANTRSSAPAATRST